MSPSASALTLAQTIRSLSYDSISDYRRQVYRVYVFVVGGSWCEFMVGIATRSQVLRTCIDSAVAGRRAGRGSGPIGTRSLRPAVRNPTWEVIFTSEQINAWLAADLEQKFPQLLPTGVSEPRVAIEDGLAKVACRYTSPKFSTVFSLELDSFLTETTNEFAIRIAKARAGALPVPLKRFFDQITARAEEANLSVLWTQQEDSPVALVKLPTNLDDVRSDVVIEVIEIEEGQIRIAGRVVPGVELQSMPQQPRFADASQPR